MYVLIQTNQYQTGKPLQVALKIQFWVTLEDFTEWMTTIGEQTIPKLRSMVGKRTESVNYTWRNLETEDHCQQNGKLKRDKEGEREREWGEREQTRNVARTTPLHQKTSNIVFDELRGNYTKSIKLTAMGCENNSCSRKLLWRREKWPDNNLLSAAQDITQHRLSNNSIEKQIDG